MDRILVDLRHRAGRRWVALLWVLLFVWLDLRLHRDLLTLALAVAGLGLVLYGRDLGERLGAQSAAASVRSAVPPRARPLLPAALALVYYLLRGRGTSGGAGILAILAALATGAGLAYAGPWLDHRLGGLFVLRDRLAHWTAVLLVPVGAIVIAFLVIQGSLGDLPAFFGASTSHLQSPNGAWGTMLAGCVLATAWGWLLGRRAEARGALPPAGGGRRVATAARPVVAALVLVVMGALLGVTASAQLGGPTPTPVPAFVDVHFSGSFSFTAPTVNLSYSGTVKTGQRFPTSFTTGRSACEAYASGETLQGVGHVVAPNGQVEPGEFALPGAGGQPTPFTSVGVVIHVGAFLGNNVYRGPGSYTVVRDPNVKGQEYLYSDSRQALLVGDFTTVSFTVNKDGSGSATATSPEPVHFSMNWTCSGPGPLATPGTTTTTTAVVPPGPCSLGADPATCADTAWTVGSFAALVAALMGWLLGMWPGDLSILALQRQILADLQAEQKKGVGKGFGKSSGKAAGRAGKKGGGRTGKSPGRPGKAGFAGAGGTGMAELGQSMDPTGAGAAAGAPGNVGWDLTMNQAVAAQPTPGAPPSQVAFDLSQMMAVADQPAPPVPPAGETPPEGTPPPVEGA